MDSIARLKRVTDLFVEGIEVYLGDDDSGNPVVVWVNKLNSFEIEDARRDGVARRGERMAELGKPDNPERAGMEAEMATWTDEGLQRAWVTQKVDEVYLDVLNDIETDPEWRERVERMRRLPDLLDDGNVPEDDPRRKELAEEQNAYVQAVADGQAAKHKELLEEAAGMERSALERDFAEKWRQRQTLDEFMEERRSTELFIALRECQATRKGTADDGRQLWDHTNCNHNQKLLPDRKMVRQLPEPVIAKVIDAVDGLRISQREAGNSDAPASSSASSGQSSAAEVPSIPSIPTEMPSGAPMS